MYSIRPVGRAAWALLRVSRYSRGAIAARGFLTNPFLTEVRGLLAFCMRASEHPPARPWGRHLFSRCAQERD